MGDVRRTIEFDRIAALPRRVLTRELAEDLAAELTPHFTREGSPARAGGLRPWQALAIAEVLEQSQTYRLGAWLALPVGQGKTIIAEALPSVTGCEGRAILVLPATLRDKTYADRAELTAAGWVLSRIAPRIVTREELQGRNGAELLKMLRPKLIIIDESGDWANAEAAAPSRVDRYILDSDQTDEPCIVVTLTGTPGRVSILDYWHSLCWTLGDRAPVPRTREEAYLWAAALDERPNVRGRGVKRPGPGPLGETREAAREWYARRVRETPGVVIVDEDSAADVPLEVSLRYARECSEIDQHYERFLVGGVNPAGIDVSDPLSAFRVDAQLGCGLYSYFDPPPPEAWANARRAAARFCRGAILRSRKTSRPLDTEGQVFRRYADTPEIREWLDIRGTFKPNSKSEWVSDSALESVIEWLDEEPTPGIVMTGVVEFAERLAQRTGLEYYRQRGRSASGRGLHAAPPDRSLIASWYANKQGFNLQAWDRLLIVTPPPSAKYLEQIIGRLHRAGQERPVRVTILLTSGGTYDAFHRACEEAEFVKSTLSLTQKILRADIAPIRKPAVTESNKFRWASRDAFVTAMPIV